MGSICLNRPNIVDKKRLNRPDMFLVTWESLNRLNIRCKKETQWAQYVSIGSICVAKKRFNRPDMILVNWESLKRLNIRCKKETQQVQYVSIGSISLQKRDSIRPICFWRLGGVSKRSHYRCKKETQQAQYVSKGSICFNMFCVTWERLETLNERWGAGVEYHFQEFNEPYAPS